MSSEERIRILGLLKDGKVSVEEADELLEALPAPGPVPPEVAAWAERLDRTGERRLSMQLIAAIGFPSMGLWLAADRGYDRMGLVILSGYVMNGVLMLFQRELSKQQVRIAKLLRGAIKPARG